MKLYIPTCNSAHFLKRVSIDTRFEVVVVDNCSKDETVIAAKERGWLVVEQKTPCSRVENWHFAASHFLNSKALWAKWLFTGDELLEDSYDTLQTAIERFPAAKLIVAEYFIDTGAVTSLWSMFKETKMVMPKDALKLAAELGNWFGAPIAHAFHRDALLKGFNFGPWGWVADMHFFLSMAKNCPLLYLKEPIGTFNAPARKFFSKEQNALKSSIEEFLIRQEAARLWFEATGDHASYLAMQDLIETDTERLIVQRAINRLGVKSSWLARLKKRFLKALI